MSNKRQYNLTNLPDNFRKLFSHTSNQIFRYGDAIKLVDISFLINQIVFFCDFGDETKNSQAESFRNLVYEGFNNEYGFVDDQMDKLKDNCQEYIDGLYTQGLIYLWTSLENLVKQLIINLINYDEKKLTVEPLKKGNCSAI